MTRLVAAALALAATLAASAVMAQDAPPPEPPAPQPEPSKPDMAKDAEATRVALVEKRLSVDLKGVPLEDALGMLATTAGVGLSIDGHVPGDKLTEPLDLKLDHVSVYAVMRWVFLKRDLTWAVRGRDILVAPPEFIDAEMMRRQKEFVEKAEDAWEGEARPKLASAKLSLDVSEVPLESALALVSERAGIALVWAEGAEKLRARPSSLKIENATLAEILNRFTAPAGLSWGLEGEAIVLTPK